MKSKINNISKKQLYKQVSPAQKTLNGRLCLSFKDVMRNLIIQELTPQKNINPYVFIDKIKSSSEHASMNRKGMSPKHRKRLQRQHKRLLERS